ncbi:MAG: NAD-binding protein [Kofleriaceae bacterium]
MIGLGRTGLPIATNLIGRGHEVIGYRRHMTPEFTGIPATNVREVARAKTIFTILPSVEALDDVMTELVPVLDGHTIVELGSHPIAAKEKWRDALASRGSHFLDGEISGTPPMTAARTAVLLVAGDERAAIPLIELCKDASDHVRYAGAFGGATKLKLVANHLVAVHTVAAAEAMLLVKESGLDPKLAIEVLGLGAGSSTMLKMRAPMMANRAFEPAAGPVGMLSHYLSPIDELAGDLQLPLFEAAAELFRKALATGRRDQDIGCVIELLDRKGRP